MPIRRWRTSKGNVWEKVRWTLRSGSCRSCLWPITISGPFPCPSNLQTASETLAQKAIAAGFVGEQVDGNDVIAVRAAADEAIEHARAGKGPRLIEALTYRLSDHTTADDAGRYKCRGGCSGALERRTDCAIALLPGSRKLWGKSDEETLAAECQQAIEAAVERYTRNGTAAAGACSTISMPNSPGVCAAARGEGQLQCLRSRWSKPSPFLPAPWKTNHDVACVLGEDVGINGRCSEPLPACSSGFGPDGSSTRRSAELLDKWTVRRDGGAGLKPVGDSSLWLCLPIGIDQLGESQFWAAQPHPGGWPPRWFCAHRVRRRDSRPTHHSESASHVLLYSESRGHAVFQREHTSASSRCDPRS